MFKTKADAVNAVLMLGSWCLALLVQRHRAVCGGAEGGAEGGAGNLLGRPGQVVSEWVTGGVRHDSNSASCGMPPPAVLVRQPALSRGGRSRILGRLLGAGIDVAVDPHWRFIPMCISFFYYSHPTAARDTAPRIAQTLVLVWAGDSCTTTFAVSAGALGGRRTGGMRTCAKATGNGGGFRSFLP